MIDYLRFIAVSLRLAWRHRGGRKCGPNCHCEDYI